MKIKMWKIVVTAIVIIIACMAAFVFLNLPKPLSASDGAYTLSQIEDGTYTGRCNNGIVRVLVEVDIQDHAITNIRIAEHDNGLGTPAEALAEDIIERQSVEVDAVSGATYSSKTIMKAVENALSGQGG